MRILDGLMDFKPHIEESNVFALDDPELCEFPIVYMTEAGFWTLTDNEAAAFRAYLLKGGFVIFDDFRDPPRGGGGWENFEANMKAGIAGGTFCRPGSHSADFSLILRNQFVRHRAASL
jgi:hypothetical protein